MRHSETQTGISRLMHGSALRSPWVWLLLVGGVALGLAFYADTTVADWIATHQSRTLREWMRSVSRWGDWPSHVIAGAACAGIAYARGNRRWCKIFVAMVVACAIAGLATRIIKMAAGRSRPSVQVDVGWNGPSLSSKYHAFPSGHTAASTAFFATLGFVSWRAGAALAVIPLLIAFSRVYVRAHYPSDVVGAALIGVAVALALTHSRFLRGDTLPAKSGS